MCWLSTSACPLPSMLALCRGECVSQAWLIRVGGLRYTAWLKARGLQAPDVSLRHFRHVTSRKYRSRLAESRKSTGSTHPVAPAAPASYSASRQGVKSLLAGIFRSESAARSGSAAGSVSQAGGERARTSHSLGWSIRGKTPAAPADRPGGLVRRRVASSHRARRSRLRNGVVTAASQPRAESVGTGGGLGSSGAAGGMLELYATITGGSDVMTSAVAAPALLSMNGTPADGTGFAGPGQGTAGVLRPPSPVTTSRSNA